MKRKKIFPLTLDALEALSTKQLLARLKRLHQCEESLALSDREVESNQSSEIIEFKDTSAWAEEFKKVKEVLARREHVLKGAALAQAQRMKIQSKGNSPRGIRRRQKC